MKKFEFKLETVLKIRTRIEEQRKIELHQAEVKRSEAECQLRLTEKEVEDTSHRYHEFLSGRFDLNLANHYNHYLTWLNHLRAQNQQYLLYCENIVTQARQQLQDAAKEKKIIEKLKEKAYEEYKALELLEETKFLDELGTNRFLRQDTNV